MTGPWDVSPRVFTVWPGFIVTYGTGSRTATLISATSSIAATVSVVAREVMRASLSPAWTGRSPRGRSRRRPDGDATGPIGRLGHDTAGPGRQRLRERRRDAGAGRVVAHAVVTLPAGPRRPDHRHGGDPQRDRQPPQHTHADQRKRLLHAAGSLRMARRHSAWVRGRAECGRTTRTWYRHRGYGVPTHSSVPSLNRWCFQIGTVALSSSIRSRQASIASPRCAAQTPT